MNPILHYDVARLHAFQKNSSISNFIQVSELENLTVLKFKPIQYFNYAMGQIQTFEILDQVAQSYLQNGIAQHEFLIDAVDVQSRSILEKSGQYSPYTKIALMKLALEDTPFDFEQKGLTLDRVTRDTIDEFAWLYLESFEAENRHSESVESNFREKLEIEGLELFFIREQETPVGVSGIFHSQSYQTLSVGAILPKFRNRGFHKMALSQRLQWCRKSATGVPVYSWAYTGSVSHQNMEKVGMSLAQEILVYRHAK